MAKALLPFLILFSTTWTLFSGSAHGAEPPNLLVILADDQGWGDLSLHGNRNLDTPHLDRLAAEGAQFANFYVQPVCSPTRAEFLTGRHYPRGGVYDTGAGGERLDADEETIAEVFKKAGYATAAFGKWHNGTQAPYHPLTRGFDHYYGFTSGHWGSYFDPLLDLNGSLTTGSGYLPNDLTDHTLAFIEEQVASSRPFFAYLALPTPHSPMQTTDADWARFENKTIAYRATHPDLEAIDHTRAALAMVENIDYNVGRLLDRIQSLGISDNTVVVYFSDNGPNGWRWNAGMRGRKGSTDEGGTRSPLFIRYPKAIPANLEVDALAGAIDLLPTLTELAGIRYSPRQTLDGVSLAPRLIAPNFGYPDPDRVLVHYWSGRLSARSQDYRLDHSGRLYHIPTDRDQSRDLANSLPGIAAKLQSAIDAYRSELLPADSARPQRPLTVGYPGLAITQLPARDAQWTGNIKRSNRWPNCSYLTRWVSDSDTIVFQADVGQAGPYRATVYHTSNESAIGARITLRSGSDEASAPLSQSHNPPPYGMRHDRVPREESYVKDFARLDLGSIQLQSGAVELLLSAAGLDEEPSSPAMLEFRLLLLEPSGENPN